MTEDVNEQVEAEETGEEVDVDVEGPVPRPKRSGFWVVTTLILLVISAALAWLYTIQLDELAALRSDAEQARNQVVGLQQRNRQVSAKLAELMDKLREVVKVVDELEGVEELQPAEAATEAPESQPAEIAEPAEEAKPAEQQRPGAPRPRVPAVPPRP